MSSFFSKSIPIIRRNSHSKYIVYVLTPSSNNYKLAVVMRRTIYTCALPRKNSCYFLTRVERKIILKFPAIQITSFINCGNKLMKKTIVWFIVAGASNRQKSAKFCCLLFCWELLKYLGGVLSNPLRVLTACLSNSSRITKRIRRTIYQISATSSSFWSSE